MATKYINHNIKKLNIILMLILFTSVIGSQNLRGNNLQISNVSLPSNNQIQFEIQWDNSWYASAPSYNYDAVWVFVKSQVCQSGSSPWSHANLRTTSVDHEISNVDLIIDAVSDGKGVFIHRDDLGSGNISSTTVTLKFEDTYDMAETNFEVIGIEMVYVPQGSFYLGDGSANTSSSVNSFGTAQGTSPYQVTSENALVQDQLRNNSSGAGGISAHAALIAGFPKGYNAIYCMKYEISQSQYVNFLNLLEYNQQINRISVAPNSTSGTYALASNGENRNSIKIQTAGVAYSTPAVLACDLNDNDIYNEADDGQNIACNYLSWDDLKAYLDWAALRPMTELEFEKICRGTNTVVLIEYPWGTTTINQAISNSLTNAGATNEVSTSTADGLCNQNGGTSTTLGPLRTGFAATSITSRTGAGSGFYGVMDLGGGVWEQCFQTGWNGTGNVRLPVPNFTGVLGNGALDGNGNADATNWGAVAYSTVRGGNWEYVSNRCTISDRFYINVTTENSTRVARTGGRGVRQP